MHEWPDRYRIIAMAWLNEQWNVPSRSDHYLMRIAQRITQQWSKKKTSLKDQRVTFTLAQKDKRPDLTAEERIAHSKATWMGGVKAYQENKRGN